MPEATRTPAELHRRILQPDRVCGGDLKRSDAGRAHPIHPVPSLIVQEENLLECAGTACLVPS